MLNALKTAALEATQNNSAENELQLLNAVEKAALATTQNNGVEKKQLLFNALEKAVLATSKNIAGFDEHTRVLLACDVSCSMYSPISPNSSIKYYDIGLVLAMLLKNRCKNVISAIFGSEWKLANLPSIGILSNVEKMYERAGEVGYSTNGYKVIEYLNKENYYCPLNMNPRSELAL